MNKIIQKSIFLLLISVISISVISCDKISEPYTETPVAIITTRKVLLEDYTGHTCPNCPNAAKEAAKIADSLYKDQVVVMALHVSTTFAAPHPGLFYYDFRTPAGDAFDLAANFNISATGLPGGMVDRIGYPTTQKKNYTEWASDVALELAKPAVASIGITNEYDTISRIVTSSIKSKFLSALSGKYYLSVMYVEDSIIQPQVTPTNGIDTNYVHMHALRGSLNGTWGDQIALDPTADFTADTQYSIVLRTDAVAKNCRVVAFIYNDTTKEVIQAEEKRIQ